MSKHQNAIRWTVNAFYHTTLFAIALVLAFAVVTAGAGIIEGVIG